MRVTQQNRLTTSAIYSLLQKYHRIQRNIILVERLFNYWIDSLHENCNVPMNFNWILSLTFEQLNWGLNKLEYSSGKSSAIRAQHQAQAPSALSSNCLRIPRTLL